MTTTDTLDVEASVAQAARLAEAGCEIVRLTAPTVEAARALEFIRAGLRSRGLDVPLVADIHFSPDAAEAAADFADKIRINPGNFPRERFPLLVDKLKHLKRSLRIGVNHGSLSERILSRYGDTPQGMVESALEFARLCEEQNYRELVFSMKASNVKVMIAAYRLLAARMAEAGMDYPFHLGVTEAWAGEDGRIKSAVGIGSLLEDGIGDTLRVSLTEEPEAEIPVCRALAERFQDRQPESLRLAAAGASHCPDLYGYSRRRTRPVSLKALALGNAELVRVVVNLPLAAAPLPASGDRGSEVVARGIRDLAGLEGIDRLRPHPAAALLLRADGPLQLALACLPAADVISWTGWRLWDEPEFIASVRRRGIPLLVEAAAADVALSRGRAARQAGVPVILGLRGDRPETLLREYRLLAAQGQDFPVHLRAPRAPNPLRQVLDASTLIGSLLCDGVGDSVEIDSGFEPVRELELAYNILQGAGVRASKTEFISCPGCGRTLFDLQATTERVKRELGHLKGVKIAVMGCIVNGPGEMADADFGYVGGAPGKINLYVGKDCVRKGVPPEKAVETLKELIKERGRWLDKR
jgi:(E)-4-hydroxy-3-methylbut-2-enyl-diphosphate synthase